MGAFVILDGRRRSFCLPNKSNYNLNNRFYFSAFYNKYNFHLPNNKIPLDNFLTLLIGFVQGKGSFILNNRGDCSFLIIQVRMHKQVIELIQEIFGFGKVLPPSPITSRYATQKKERNNYSQFI
jgi:hypothetical protein